MAVELGAGYISTFPKLDEGKTRAATNDLENQLERAGDEGGRRAGDGFAGAFGGGVKKAIGLAAAAFAGLQVGSYLKGAIDAASDLGETTSKVSQIFGSEALPALEEFAAGAAKSLGQSKQSALDAAATFGVFGKSAGLTGKDLSDFSSEMVTLASDLASFGNTSPEEAIEAIGSALRGEAEPIRQYGVLLDDATLKNRALALGLISTTKDALTPQQKVLAAQAEILAQTSDAQGDFARTSGGLANQQRILAAMLQNGKTALGQAFLPAATAVVTFLVSKGIPAFQEFTAVIRDEVFPIFAAAGDKIGEFFKALTTGFTENEGTGVEKFAIGLRQAFKALTTGLTEDEGTAVERFALVLRGAFLTVRDAIGEALSALRTGFTEDEGTTAEKVGLAIRDAFFLARDGAVAAKDAIVAVIGYVADHQDAFTVAASGALGFASALGAIAAAQQAVSTVSALGSSAGLLGKILPVLLTPAGLIAALLVAIGVAAFVAYKKFEPFRNIVDTVASTIKDVALDAFERLKPVLEQVGPAFDKVKDALGGAKDAVVGAKDGFVGFATEARAKVEPFVTWFQTHVTPTLAAGWDAFIAATTRVGEILGAFLLTAQTIFSALLTIAGPVFDALGSAFSTFIAVVQPIWDGFWNAVQTVASTVFDLVRIGVETVLGVIRGIFQTVTGLIDGDWSKFWEGIRTIADTVIGLIKGLVETGLDAVKGIFTAAFDAVKTTVSTALDEVVGLVGGLAERAKTAAGDLLGTLVQKGRDLIQGVINGVGEMWETLKGAVDDIPDTVTSAVGDLGDVLYDAGWDIIQGLIDGIVDAVPGLERTLKWVTDKIPDWKGPADVDRKILEDSGVMLMQGLMAGINSQLPPLQAQLTGVTQVIEQTVVAAPQVQSVVAQPAVVSQAQQAQPFLTDGGRWAVYLDGSELQRSLVRRERAGR